MILMKTLLDSNTWLCLSATSAMAFVPLQNASACTGISLRAADAHREQDVKDLTPAARP